MDLEENLNIYQKKRIKERLELNFQEEKNKKSKDKSEFLKKFKNYIRIFSTELYNNGVMFYGFTLRMPFIKNDSDFWYYVHLQIEKLIIDFRDNIELIEFCYLSIEHSIIKEKNLNENRLILFDSNLKENTPCFHGILGVRSIIGNNNFHFNEIRKLLSLNYSIELKNLSSLKSVINHWYFVIREENFKFHRFCQYSRYYEFLYGTIADLELQYDSDHYAFSLDEDLNSKNVEIEGIKERNPDNVTIINYLVTLYFFINKLSIKDNLIFKRLDNSLYSWEFLDSIDFLDKNNLFILKDLKKNFPQQLSNLKLSKLLNSSWSLFFNIIKKQNHYISSFNFVKDKIEFKDGIYFVSENKFYSFDKNHYYLEKNLKDINLIFYYDDYFDKLKIPEVWLDFLNKNNMQLTDSFCIDFANHFHKNLNIEFKYNIFLSDVLFINSYNRKKKFNFPDFFSILNGKRCNKSLVEIIVYCNKLYFLNLNGEI